MNDLPLKETKRQKVNEDVGKFGMWVNDNIVGNPITFVLAIISVVVVYSFLFFMSYAQWNTGIGLFYNTLSSSFELITGVGAVVGVVVLHKKHKNAQIDNANAHVGTQNTLLDLHKKMDRILKERDSKGD